MWLLFTNTTATEFDYLILISYCIQAAEIKDTSQKCKQKQDALEMKDKQVRVLVFVTFLCVSLLLYKFSTSYSICCIQVECYF